MTTGGSGRTGSAGSRATRAGRRSAPFQRVARLLAPRPAGGRPGHRRAAVLVAGVVAVAAYLVGAAWSGSLDPVARRPLLDGLAPPPPYRWVDPPPGIPNSDKPPERGRFEVKLTGEGSEVGAFATGDAQLSLVLSEGAMTPSEGDTEVVIEAQPVATSELAPLPSGLLVATNAYRVTATYQPSGEPAATQLGGQSTVTLTYALLSAPVAGASSHVILFSPDGRDWERLQTTDTAAAHQASAAFASLGYYVVGVPPGSGETGGGGIDLTSILVPAVIAVALISIALLVLRRAETVTGGRSRQRRRRPPPRKRRR